MTDFVEDIGKMFKEVIMGEGINQEKKDIFEQIEKSNEHFFITGKAGTGKSTLLSYIVDNTDKQVVTVAPTGKAAIVVNAQTIHSLFQIPPFLFTVDGEMKALHKDKKKMLQNVDMVIIDEVSMVRADLLEAINWRLRDARKSKKPFGGVQMIMFGDLYQLPPIVTDNGFRDYLQLNYGSKYFFNSKVWSSFTDNGFRVIELKEVFRQKDSKFKDILNNIRDGSYSEEDLLELNTRVIAPNKNVINYKEYTTLSTTNYKVDKINSQVLNSLEAKEYKFEAKSAGDFKDSELPADKMLSLKVGSRVMLLVNNPDNKFVNGSVGVLKKINKSVTGNGFDGSDDCTDADLELVGSDIESLTVEIDGRNVVVERHSWDKFRFEYNSEENEIDKSTIGRFLQFPVRLAWALTIHKSQGQTITTPTIVDMNSGAFQSGQTYVALSRVSRMDNLYLEKSITPNDIKVDAKVVEFMKNGLRGS